MKIEDDINQLVSMWRECKADEQKAQDLRRVVEDNIVRLLNLPEALDGVRNVEGAGVTLKITGRLNRKVDGDKAQEIAAEHGLQDHLSKLFRWRPEINLAVWKAADESITKPFAAAVTTEPGRPSFAVVTKKEET